MLVGVFLGVNFPCADKWVHMVDECRPLIGTLWPGEIIMLAHFGSGRPLHGGGLAGRTAVFLFRMPGGLSLGDWPKKSVVGFSLIFGGGGPAFCPLSDPGTRGPRCATLMSSPIWFFRAVSSGSAAFFLRMGNQTHDKRGLCCWTFGLLP